MAYQDIKEIAKQVRIELKKEFPNCKFSVRIDRFSMGQAMKVSLMESPESPYASLLSRPDRHDGSQHNINLDYNQINHHCLESDYDGNWYNNGIQLTKKAAKMLQKVVEISNRKNWNNSDAMIDYFDVNYYFDLTIGQWDKPLVVTGVKEQVQTPVEVQENVSTPVLEAIEETPEWLQRIMDNSPVIEEKEPVVKTKRVRKETPKMTFSQRVKVAFRVLKTGYINIG